MSLPPSLTDPPVVADVCAGARCQDVLKLVLIVDDEQIAIGNAQALIPGFLPGGWTGDKLVAGAVIVSELVTGGTGDCKPTKGRQTILVTHKD